MNRRRLLLGLAATAAAGGCGTNPAAENGPWHRGQITVGTGPTNGVFNQIGGGYADIITRHLPGYEAVAVPTNGAGENLQRLARGDVDVAFTFADTAADAVAGAGGFTGSPLPIRALARVFNSYTHLIVRANAPIRSLADLAGRRVGTGPVRSGTEVVAVRVLAAVGIAPQRVSGSLNQMTAWMKSGELDAMFYSAGLPTVGLTALFTQLPGTFMLLPTDSALAGTQRLHPGVYIAGTIPGATYGLGADVPTIAIPNLIVVAESTPEQIAHEMTRLVFDYQAELAAVHPEGRNISRALGAATLPVPLHAGAQRYYSSVG